jgi:hypothetical protein
MRRLLSDINVLVPVLAAVIAVTVYISDIENKVSEVEAYQIAAHVSARDSYPKVKGAVLDNKIDNIIESQKRIENMLEVILDIKDEIEESSFRPAPTRINPLRIHSVNNCFDHHNKLKSLAKHLPVNKHGTF